MTTTSPFVFALSDVHGDGAVDAAPIQVSRIGGKAAALGVLLHAGFPVPRGVCVTVDAFRFALTEFVAPIEAILRRHAPRSATAARDAADEIARLLVDLVLPSVITAPLRNALQATWPDLAVDATPLAVRSSAVGEDGHDFSFAGHYSSLIGVRGAGALHTALLTCWRSYYGAHALLARAAQREAAMSGATSSATAGGMAVLIQPVIEAECVGVCFSTDPVRQRSDQVVVNAAWGFGAGVVDGSVATDIARVSRKDLTIAEHHIAVKPEQFILDQAEGLRRAPVPSDRQRAACLPDVWLARVAQFGIAAELLFGRSQDLEWAVAADQVWLLQSRPITGLPSHLVQTNRFPVVWESDDERRTVWDRRGRDQQDDVLFPLEQDEIIQVESTREETCRLLGVERNVQLKIVNGRAYVRRIPMKWRAADRRIRQAAAEDLLARLQRQGWTIWDYWGPEIVRATERLSAFDVAVADDHALADHLADALAVHRRHWMLHPVCSFTPPAAYFDAYAAVTGKSPAEARTAAYQLLDVGETPLSGRIEGLYDLACTARQDAEVSMLIANAAPDALARLASLPQGRLLLERLDRFLDEYGELTGNGWGSQVLLRHPTWRERPETVLALLGPYLDLDAQVEPPATTRRRVQQALADQVEALCAACQDPAAAQEFRRQWAYARKVHAVLEFHNHYIDQLATGQLRHAVMAAGRRLVARGALAAAEEVLWLSFDEITNVLCDAPATALASLAEAIDLRRQQHAIWSSMQAPPVLGVPEARLPGRPPLRDDVSAGAGDEARRLVGQGASVGRCRGRARVILATDSLPKLARGHPGGQERRTGVAAAFPTPGRPDPGRGVVGQHAAATAREYGLPAAVNVAHAMECIPDGAWVTVDGRRGVGLTRTTRRWGE
jgi:pyruvate,water dikinase